MICITFPYIVLLSQVCRIIIIMKNLKNLKKSQEISANLASVTKVVNDRAKT